MKLILDTDERTLIQEREGRRRVLGLYTREAFNLLSEQWLRLGWERRYSYAFSWLGRPVIQLPEDLIRVQEVIHRVQPDVILETGIAHGGSLVFFASLSRLLDKGRVIGVDLEIRPQNRRGIETHPLSPLITLVEGDSVDPETVRRVKEQVRPGETVMVFLDSDHSKEHVLAELDAYHDLVGPGSYVVVADGIMKELHDLPSGRPEWKWNNPESAAVEFLASHPEFGREQPVRDFNESDVTADVTYWPGAWLRRK